MKVGVFSLWLMIALPSIGQTILPAFGNVSMEEYQLKQIQFDPNAEAVILHDYAEANYDDMYQLITTRRVKIKILKEAALNRANIEIPYYHVEEFEWIKDIKGYTSTLNESGTITTTQLDKSGIFQQRKNEQISLIKFAMPQVKVGSIIEYSYTSVQKHYGGLDEWTFQSDIPTIYSHYNLVIRPNLEFAYRIIKSPWYNVSVKSIAAEGRMIFEMRNIAGLRNEPFMDALNDYRNRVVFQLSEYTTQYGARKKYATTWDDLSRELLSSSYLGKAIEKKLGGSDELIKSAKMLTDETERLKMITTFFKNSFSWNGKYSTIAYEGLKKIWEQKKGNSGELNLLLINLLKELNMETYPVLVSHRHLGLVDDGYPFENQFNSVLTLVKANGRTYYLDAANLSTPLSYIPFNYINTKGFVLKKNAAPPLLLEDTIHKQRNLMGARSIIMANGKIEGEVNCKSFDYSQIDRTVELKELTEDRFIAKYFLSEINNIQIDSIAIKRNPIDSLPLEQKFNYSTEATQNGDYLIVSLNNFFGFEKNPFVSENRFTNIHFGTAIDNQLSHLFVLPEGFKPEELPKTINLIMPDKSISFLRSVNYDPGARMVMVRLKLEINNSIFKPQTYPSVSQFFKKMVDLLNEPLVLRKK